MLGMARIQIGITLIMIGSGGVGWASAQPAWAALGIRFRDACTQGTTRWSLCRLAYIEQTTSAPDGGPQALEGYTKVNHTSGKVQLPMSVIANQELSGGSGTVVQDARVFQAGAVVSDAGVVEDLTFLNLTGPNRMGGYDGPINIKRVTYLRFPNGWTIRPGGSGLLLCDPRDACRGL